MSLIINPPPGIYANGVNVDIKISGDITNFAITSNGIPPVIAKYIAYDNLSPRNPFIATVEDGLGKVLLDGGFPKWYNTGVNPNWNTYASLNASFKYLYDALGFIANPDKIAAGNKKILVLGDADAGMSYSIKGTAASGFRTSLDKVFALKGFIPTYKTLSDYSGVLNATYAELNQYHSVIFFSTVFTPNKLITDSCIQALIGFRETKNGLFFITDHGENLSNLNQAANGTYAGFFRTANHVITNFGCYFTGNFDRLPVNVGFLRSNYGNHVLWKNLLDSEYINAGGSESKVVVTVYPLFNKFVTSLTTNGYTSYRILTINDMGEVGSDVVTYGINVPELVYFLKPDKTVVDNTGIDTMVRNHVINFKIDSYLDLDGLIKINSVPIGFFNFSATTKILDINYDTGYSKNITISGDDNIFIQVMNPVRYIKGYGLNFKKPKFGLRVNKVINDANILEFKTEKTSSPFRNINDLIVNGSLNYKPSKRFKYTTFYNYFN